MEYNRVKWASRRGMLELDLFLGPFIENRYLDLPEPDQRRFQKLLGAEDQDLYQYLMGYAQPEDADMAAATELVRGYAREPRAAETATPESHSPAADTPAANARNRSAT